MRKTIAFSIMLIYTGISWGQKTGTLSNQVDSWGVTYSYVGEIKDGKPNGMGIAKYSNNHVLRYVGHFDNGVFNGKGVMLFTDSIFLAGDWKNGKIDGTGANLTSDGSIYFGQFSNGLKSGEGVVIYKNNGFDKGTFVNDKLNGRDVNLWSSGKIISDIVYKDNNRNGKGYQYEIDSKSLYQGEWADDKWQTSGTADFSSFLTAPGFTAEQTDGHILIGSVNADKYLDGTGYFYNLQTHKRFFGKYANGYLSNGIEIVDDSTRFMGPLDANGAQGFSYDYKIGSYFSMGNYTNDKLNGDIIDIDLTKLSVYIGQATDGYFTGKAYFFNGYGAMYSGDYVAGKFTGTGYKLDGNGRLIAGTWDDGSPTKVTALTDYDGKTINPYPKTFAEGVNIITQQYANAFYDDIMGSLSDDDDANLDWLDLYSGSDYADYYYTYVTFPGGVSKDYITTDFDSTNLYTVTFLNTTDKAKAAAKYKDIIRQLQAVTVTNAKLTAPAKFKTSKVAEPDFTTDETITDFTLDNSSESFEIFHAWVRLAKDTDGNYKVYLEMGEKN